MSLYYPSSEHTFRGKTREREDRYTARFVELTPPRRIVEAITFDAVDPAFSGEMIMVVTSLWQFQTKFTLYIPYHTVFFPC